MKKYTNFIVKNRKFLMVLLLLLNIVALIGVTKIRLNTDFSMFSPKESIYDERLTELEETFGELNQIIVMVEHNEFEDTTIEILRKVQKQIEEMENVVFVQGVAPEYLVVDSVEVLTTNLTATDVENYYNNFGEFSPLKKIGDTYYSSFTVFITENFNKDDIGEIEETLDSISYPSYISGDLYNQLKISDYIIKILTFLPALTILVILLVFRWQMGAIKPTLMSVLPAGLGTLWTFGIIGWLGNEVSILTAVVPIFIIVIGSADGLHFMSHFQDSKKDKKSNITSLNETLKIVGIPMIVTTLTSMVGFISLLSMNTDSIFDLAVFSSVGILLAGVATWFVLPLILTHIKNVLPKKESTLKSDVGVYIKKLWGLPTLIIVFTILIVSAFTYKYINNEFNMLMIYKDYTIVNKNAEKVTEVNGGSIPIYVTINLDNPLLSLDSLNEVNSYVSRLEELDEVNKIVNPYSLFNIVYQNMGTGDIPNDATLQMIYSNISSDENSVIHNLVAVDEGIVRLLVFPQDLNNDTLTNIEIKAESYSENITVTGVQYLMKDLNLNISEMQIYSIAIALGAVLVMLVVTLRSFKVAFYSLLPIVITVISLYGFLGISSIPLNITTVIIFSITIGVGIDYAVHFSSVYRHFLKEGQNNNIAIETAYKYTSRPIITNALGISLGLSILMLSPLTIHLNVSLLMWVSMIVSVIITLTLLPLLFRLKRK